MTFYEIQYIRIEKGVYTYKNGEYVERSGKSWDVYITKNGKKIVLFSGKSMRDCKNYLAN